MLTTVDPGRAGVEHREQRRETLERGAVADRGRHRHDRHADQPTHHAGQRALHAGDHDQAVRGGQAVAHGEHAVQAGHADVGHQLGRGAVGRERHQGLARDRQVARAGGDHDDVAVRLRQRPERGGARDRVEHRQSDGPAVTAAIAASSSRVASTARSGWASCSAPRISTTCCGVLPCPKTTSGSPVRRARSTSRRASAPSSTQVSSAGSDIRSNTSDHLRSAAMTSTAPGAPRRARRPSAPHHRVQRWCRQPAARRRRAPGRAGHDDRRPLRHAGRPARGHRARTPRRRRPRLAAAAGGVRRAQRRPLPRPTPSTAASSARPTSTTSSTGSSATSSPTRAGP